MKKVILSNASTGNLHEASLNDLDQMQDGYSEALASILKGLVDPTLLVKLHGAGVTKVSTTYTVTAGAIAYNGEVYQVDAQVLVSGATVNWEIVTTYPTEDPVIYSSGSAYEVHRIDKMHLVAGAGLTLWSTPLPFGKVDKAGLAGGTTGMVFTKLSNADYDYGWVAATSITGKADKSQFLLESVHAAGPTSFSPSADNVVLTLVPSATLGSAKMKYTFMGYLSSTSGGTMQLKIKKNGITIADTKNAEAAAQQLTFCLVWIDTYAANDTITATVASIAGSGGEVNNYILICEAMDAV